jgi:hypothetical protein
MIAVQTIFVVLGGFVEKLVIGEIVYQMIIVVLVNVLMQLIMIVLVLLKLAQLIQGSAELLVMDVVEQ